MGYRASAGFTIVEMIVTIVVVGIFVGLLFQGFIAATSQRVQVVRLSDAHDLATSNLKKYTKKLSLPSTVACNNAVTDSSNPNNYTYNTTAPGSVIGKAQIGGSLTGTALPSSTDYYIEVVYPRGCGAQMPALLRSVVKYDAEKVTHVEYVN